MSAASSRDSKRKPVSPTLVSYKAGSAGRLLLNQSAHGSSSFVDYGELVYVVAVLCYCERGTMLVLALATS